jgi:hypothetical protein
LRAEQQAFEQLPVEIETDISEAITMSSVTEQNMHALPETDAAFQLRYEERIRQLAESTQIIDDDDDVNRYNTAFLHYDDDAGFAEEEEHDREVWEEVPEELLDEVNGCFSGLRYHLLG